MKYIFYICNPDMSVETEELNCETALDALYFAASNFFDLRTANLDDAEEVEEENKS